MHEQVSGRAADVQKGKGGLVFGDLGDEIKKNTVAFLDVCRVPFLIVVVLLQECRAFGVWIVSGHEILSD